MERTSRVRRWGFDDHRVCPTAMASLKLKSAHEISLTFTLSFILGVILWLFYGISLSLASVILWNAIALVLGCAMLYAKLKYGR